VSIRRWADNRKARVRAALAHVAGEPERLRRLVLQDWPSKTGRSADAFKVTSHNQGDRAGGVLSNNAPHMPWIRVGRALAWDAVVLRIHETRRAALRQEVRDILGGRRG